MSGDKDAPAPSPAGFDPLEPERENMKIRCAGCGEIEHAEDMEVVGDRQAALEEDGGDVVISAERQYFCSGECAVEAMSGEGLLARRGDGGESV